MDRDLKRGIAFVVMGAALAALSDLEPLDSVADANLVIHHFQHVIIIFGGFSVGYGLGALYRISWNERWARFKSGWARLNKGGYLAGALFMIVFNFWHIPGAFTFTILPGNESVHFLEHVMFFATSALLVAATPFMSRTFKAVYIFVFGSMNSMMGVLYSVWGTNLFAPYPAYQQDQFGLLMSASGFLTMTIGTFVYIYLSERRLNSEAAKGTSADAKETLITGGQGGLSEP